MKILYGHDKEKSLLTTIINKSTYSHAYAFEGKDGIGKLLIAKEFAKAILKTDNLETSPDYVFVDKKEDKKDILVEQIRENIIEKIYMKPAVNDKKVYIINNAHLLNIQAQNALLKTLEEPPPYVVIILVCTNVQAFLPTIISRINKIHFECIDKDKLNKYIKEHYDISINENTTCFFDGSIGKAISIIENSTYDKFEQIEDLLKKLEEGKKLESLLLVSSIDFKEEYLLDYLEFIIFRLLEKNISKSYNSAIEEVEKAKLSLKRNGNYDIVIDNMIINIFKVMGANI